MTVWVRVSQAGWRMALSRCLVLTRMLLVVQNLTNRSSVVCVVTPARHSASWVSFFHFSCLAFNKSYEMSFFRPAPIAVEMQQSDRNGTGATGSVAGHRHFREDSKLPETSTISVISETAGLLPDKQLEAAYSKVSARLVPLFMLVVLCNQIDRNNLAYAALTMNRDLGFSASTYGLGAALFFLSFCVFQVPSNLVMVRVGVRRWLSLLVVGWGCTACLFALISNPASFFTLRLLLGVFEAGATPAMWFHFSQFYPQERLVKPYMYMAVGLLLSNVVGAPLAAGFLALDGVGGLRGWQHLFLLEGLPSILVGVLLFFILPDSVAQSNWLKDSEKELLLADMASSAKQSPERQQIPRSSPLLLKTALSNPLISYIALVGFMVSQAAYSFIFFLPIIVNSLLTGQALAHVGTAAKANSNPLQAVLLTCIPYTVSAAVSWFVAYNSQKRKELFYHITFCLVVGGVAMLLFPPLTKASMVVGFACLSIMSAAVAASTGPTHALVARISSGPSLVVGMPLYNSIASLGGFLGPFLTGAILQRSAKGFTVVFIVNGSLIVVCAVMVFVMKFLAAARDKKLAAAGDQWDGCPDDVLPVKSKQSDAGLTASAVGHMQQHDVLASGSMKGVEATPAAANGAGAMQQLQKRVSAAVGSSP